MADLETLASRTIAGIPLPVVVVALGGIGFLFVRSRNKSTSDGGTSDDQFTSSQDTQTTDANGNTVTSSFSASGSAPLPGFLTTAGNPMPYSTGDVYVNVPAPTTTVVNNPPTPPIRGGGTATWPPPNSVPYVVTGKGDQNLSGIVTNFYHLAEKTDPAEFAKIVADISNLNQNNPNRSTWGSKIPVGTQIYLPANFAHGATTALPNGQQTTASSTVAVK